MFEISLVSTLVPYPKHYKQIEGVLSAFMNTYQLLNR